MENLFRFLGRRFVISIKKAMTKEIHYSIQIPLGASVTSGSNNHVKEKKDPAIVTWHIIRKNKKEGAYNVYNPQENRHFVMEATDLTKLMNTLNQIQIRCDQLQH